MSFRLKLFAFAAALIWPPPGRRRPTISRSPSSTAAPVRLQAYAKQTETGLRLGFEYATKGTMEVDGRKIVIITKDDQGKPDLAKSALAEAYEDDGADIAVGTTLLGRGDRHAAGRRGAQEDPRSSNRRSPTRSPATSGTATSSAPRAIPRRTRSRTRSRSASPACISRRWRRITPSAATASPRSRQALAKTGATARRRGICADQHHRFHRPRAAPVRRAEG